MVATARIAAQIDSSYSPGGANTHPPSSTTNGISVYPFVGFTSVPNTVEHTDTQIAFLSFHNVVISECNYGATLSIVII